MDKHTQGEGTVSGGAQKSDVDVRSEIKKEIFSWVKTILFAVVLSLVLSNFVVINAQVPTGSMMDTIMKDDRIFAFRLQYLFSEPSRNDIAVFRYPDDRKVLYVKRIIGLPGETIQIRDGKVYINDVQQPLDDSFCREAPDGDFGPYEVPEGHYFMLGDNRNGSIDSRFWINTYVPKEDILGKVIFKYYKGFRLY